MPAALAAFEFLSRQFSSSQVAQSDLGKDWLAARHAIEFAELGPKSEVGADRNSR